jgi:hypothetical protein
MLNILNEMKESSIDPNMHIWCIIIDGYSRSESQEDQKKALSIWKYLSGQISHESLGIDLHVKAIHVLPDVVTMSIAFDFCKFGRFEKEADGVWMYGQKNKEIFLDSNVLTSYVNVVRLSSGS